MLERRSIISFESHSTWRFLWFCWRARNIPSLKANVSVKETRGVFVFLVLLRIVQPSWSMMLNDSRMHYCLNNCLGRVRIRGSPFDNGFMMLDENLVNFNQEYQKEKTVVTLRRMIWRPKIGTHKWFLIVELLVNGFFLYIGIHEQNQIVNFEGA